MAELPRAPAPQPLAGLASYAEAARIGIGVEENVRRLLRYEWVEQRLAFTAVAHLTATPEWEVKGALAYHQWLDIEHAETLRGRIAELRHPAPPMQRAPDPALDAFLEELLRPHDTVELLAGLYGVARPALAEAYREHLRASNPLADQPTHRTLRLVLLEEEEQLGWGRSALQALTAGDPDAGRRAQAWVEHLNAWLRAAGGIAGPARDDAPPPPPARATAAFQPDLVPRRDARFHGANNFNFPPHVIYNDVSIPADERNLALVCKRLLEMDVPEMMASFLAEQPDRPWEYRRDYARQLWDEARHSMLGEAALEARGIEWRAIPLNVGFSLRLNLNATPLERQLVLYRIEQGLMPGDTGKRFEYNTAREADDPLSALFHDYDWADEVLHAQIGRRWIRAEGLTVEDAVQRAEQVQRRTWDALEPYRKQEEQREWWQDFVRRTLGRDTAARADQLQESRQLTE